MSEREYTKVGETDDLDGRHDVVFESGEEITIEDEQGEWETQTYKKRGGKRGREVLTSDSEEKRKKIERKIKRIQENSKSDNIKLQVYISHKDPLPKQFALARLFKENNIINIQQIKYLNAFKIRLEFEDEPGMNQLLNCEALINREWKMYKAMEVSHCYGLIKNVDLDTKEEEIKNNITCPEPGELISLKRLDRRDGNGGWCPSEAIRLCFKGDFLPQFVYIFGIKIKVESYVHPVTQCSRCWKMGHSRSKCSSKKIVCPKCGNNHANCESKAYRCVNCGGGHMALSKTCPLYTKEKRLRELMAEFNCTYRKARMAYVPFSPQPSRPEINLNNMWQDNEQLEHKEQTDISTSYAQVVKTVADVHSEQHNAKKVSLQKDNHQRVKPSKKRSKVEEYMDWTKEDMQSGCEDYLQEPEIKSERKTTFKELLEKLKQLVFLKNINLQTKIHKAIKLCLEWLILMTVENISDGSLFSKIFDSIKYGL